MLVAISLLSSITSTRMRPPYAAGIGAGRGPKLNNLNGGKGASGGRQAERAAIRQEKSPGSLTCRRSPGLKLLPRYRNLLSPDLTVEVPSKLQWRLYRGGRVTV